MTRLITIEQLLAKPICMMTGEELTLLLQNTEKVTAKVPAEVVPEKHYEHGIAGIAKIFGFQQHIHGILALFVEFCFQLRRDFGIGGDQLPRGRGRLPRF